MKIEPNAAGRVVHDNELIRSRNAAPGFSVHFFLASVASCGWVEGLTECLDLDSETTKRHLIWPAFLCAMQVPDLPHQLSQGTQDWKQEIFERI
jgi:hypothetical protein